MKAFARLQPLRPLSRNPFLPPSRSSLLLRNARRRLHTSRTCKGQQQEGELSQTVKIRPPIFSWKRILYTAGSAGIAYLTAKIFLALFISKLGLEEGDLEELEDEDGDGTFFIAFQHPSKLPRTYYKQSDPEWQEFVKISNDEARKIAVTDELAERVTKDIAKHPRMRVRLGGQVQLSNSWLVLKYPNSPPPEYARQGFEIADDYIQWTTQTIPHSQYIILQHILYPKAIFTAFVNSLRIFGRLQFIKVKESLGLTLTTFDKQVQVVSRLEQTHRSLSEQKSQLEAQRDATSAKGQQLERQLNDTHPSDAAARASTSDPEDQTPSSMVLPSTKTLPPDLAIAWKMFANTLLQKWFENRVDQEPRGSFLVVGEIEVMGTRGKAKCDVKAAYDPVERKFVFVRTTVKHFWELRQVAKGGP